MSPACFKLSWLDAKVNYLVSNLDTDMQEHDRSRELLKAVLPVTIAAEPGVVILTYRKQR